MPTDAPQPGTRPADPHRLLPARIEEQEGWTILHLREASLMDPSVIEALAGHVEKLLGEGKRRLIIDFEHVQYISSSMIGVLVGARQSVVREQGKLVLVGLNRRLNELLKITRLDKMFTVAPDVTAALSQAKAQATA